MRETIHFAHGNGFPSPCYGQLLKSLGTRYDCCYIEKVGHNPEFPVGENWHFLSDEIIDSVRKQASKPVIAVGHSLGGVLSLIAAMKEPALFKTVIMLDAPIIGPFKSSMVRLAKVLGIIDRVTPAARTRNRRKHWPTKELLWTYLKEKELFRTFTDACLQDYIDYGMKKTPEGYFLDFDRHIEYLIYKTLPHELHTYKGKLTVPTDLIYGDQSTVIDNADRRYMRKHYHINSHKITGSHMFPMECPEKVAMLIFKLLGQRGI